MKIEITLLHKSQIKKTLKNYYRYRFSEVDNVKCSFQINNSNRFKVFRVQTNGGVLDLFCNLIYETPLWLNKSKWYHYSDGQRKMTKPISKTQKNKMYILSCFVYHFIIIRSNTLHRKKGQNCHWGSGNLSELFLSPTDTRARLPLRKIMFFIVRHQKT